MRLRKLLFVNALALLVSYSIILSLKQVEACGPGRGGPKRRPTRKHSPLVQRQYIPNVSENTLDASGRPEGAIKRRDKRFKELVQNLNPDIEFRDDERTGADRMMTQFQLLFVHLYTLASSVSFGTCNLLEPIKKAGEQSFEVDVANPPRLKEKLSSLAISVMNQWLNVKLRVIEGWDEDNRHSLNSLHYEGRAVDITTSDRDKSKYGMLARLAVEAGFDWVHYESRSHVHCSVKSEKANTIRNNGCFDAKSLVETPNGQMQMSQLQINDQVLTMNSKGQLQFSPIIMWLDKDEFGQELFVELKTKSNLTIRLTPSHLIYAADEVPLDLTQKQQQSPLLFPKPTKLVKQNTGNKDNNQNNYHFYYSTNNLVGQTDAVNNEGDESVPAGTISVPNMTNNVNQGPYNSAPSSVIAASIDEAAFTTYARNVVAGQYLLVNPTTFSTALHSEELKENIDGPTNKFSHNLDAFTTSSEINEGDDYNKFRYDFDQTESRYQKDVDRTQSRLVFNQNRQSTTENLQNYLQNDRSSESLLSGDDGEKPTTIRFDQIVSVNYVKRKGIYAPLTREGNIVVNSVVASCYAVISDHELAHMSFAPVRWLSFLNEFLFGLKSPPLLVDRHGGAITSFVTPSQRTNTQTKHITGRESRYDIPKNISRDLNGTLKSRADEIFTTTSREIHWYPSLLYRIARFILPTRYLY